MSIYNRLSNERPSLIHIEVLSKDRTGLVSDICAAITASGADIRYHRAKVFSDRKGAYMSRFIAEVRTGSDPEPLLRALCRIKGTVDVTADDSQEN